MLGKLLTKFKKHSLQEENTVNTTTAALAAENITPMPMNTFIQKQQQPYRRSARIIALHRGSNSSVLDSGTESDDEELEQLDSLNNEKNAHSSDIMGSSPPNLTSSPPLISEFETNSWDSIGCESGIGLQDRSGDVSEVSQDYMIDDALISQSSIDRITTFNPDLGLNNKSPIAAVNYCSEDSGKTGAFRPVTKRRSNQDLSAAISAQSAIGEKRRYENISPKVHSSENHSCNETPPLSPIATRLRSNNMRQHSLGEIGGAEPPRGTSPCTNWAARDTLVAARRQPVKLLIHNACAVRRRTNNECTTPTETRTIGQQSHTFSHHHPYKRGRITNSGRPSLDFEKMRQRMVPSNVRGIGSQEFVDSAMGESDKDIEKRKHDWALSGNSTFSSSGRRCLIHQQARCQQADCAYKTIDSETSAGMNTEQHSTNFDDQ